MGHGCPTHRTPWISGLILKSWATGTRMAIQTLKKIFIYPSGPKLYNKPYADLVARPSMPGLAGTTTSENKIYELRSLRCRGSSGARPCVPKMPCARRPVGLHWRAREALRANALPRKSHKAVIIYTLHPRGRNSGIFHVVRHLRAIVFFFCCATKLFAYKLRSFYGIRWLDNEPGIPGILTFI